jgi:CRISPR-associated endonuclease/helicase Cas3
MTPPEPWRLLWAKTPKGASQPHPYHPLICHLIDVALVAEAIWAKVLSPALRQRIAQTLQLDEQTAGRWVAFLAGLHDLGKASPVFQEQDASGRARLEAAGVRFPKVKPPKPVPHGTISAALLTNLFEDIGFNEQFSRRLAITVGGHHGVLPTSGDQKAANEIACGRSDWDQLRADLIAAFRRALGLHGSFPSKVDPGTDHAFFVILAGFTSVADWIGSDGDRFKFAAADVDLGAYTEKARDTAREALADLGWSQWQPMTQTLHFTDLFDKEPRPLQKCVIDLVGRVPAPALWLIEAPMGEGKTEAALYIADHQTAVAGRRGLYFALPTQATSNQMFGRLERYLRRRYPADVVNLHLLHGHAALSAEFERLQDEAHRLIRPRDLHDESADDLAGVMAAAWFTYKKRGLLSPHGVGTIDQALLAVLQTKHFFVRLFGLAQKTVIIDEVHAYDSYMSSLLELLLTWLAALGATVVLLSATLPSSRRQALLRAYNAGLGRADEPLKDVPYPRLCWVSGGGSDATSFTVDKRNRRIVQLERFPDALPLSSADPFELGQRLNTALAPEGGCALVICNTVGRAQAVFDALKERFFAKEEIELFHARFPFGERAEREKRALDRFGEDGKRPYRFVLVATQVVEQSLDLDFDLMVSEFAPIDLLLQRMGRLHRHKRTRPAGLTDPTFWLLMPETDADGLPQFERGTSKVYDPHILLRSWLALSDRVELRLPDQIEELVQAVYRDDVPGERLSPALQALWTKTQRDLADRREKETGKAAVPAIVSPRFESELLERFNAEREEEDPSVHSSVQAQTRLSGPSVSVVCLTAWPAEPSAEPSMAETRELLTRSLTVTRPGLANYLIQHGEQPKGWSRSPLLRHHRAVRFVAGSADVGPWRLTLDPDLGLVITERR